jgi:hypothetical protein
MVSSEQAVFSATSAIVISFGKSDIRPLPFDPVAVEGVTGVGEQHEGDAGIDLQLAEHLTDARMALARVLNLLCRDRRAEAGNIRLQFAYPSRQIRGFGLV